MPSFAYSLSQGFPGGTRGKEPTCQCRRHKRRRFYSWVGSPGGGHGSPLQYSCLENPHGQRSLVGYSSQGHKDSDKTSNWACMHRIFISKAVTCLLLSPWRDLSCAHGTSSGWEIMPNMNWKLSDPTSHKFSCPHQHSIIKFLNKNKPIPALKIQANYNGSWFRPSEPKPNTAPLFLNNSKATWSVSYGQLTVNSVPAPTSYTILLTMNLKYSDKDKPSKWAELLSVMLNFM